MKIVKLTESHQKEIDNLKSQIKSVEEELQPLLDKRRDLMKELEGCMDEIACKSDPSIKSGCTKQIVDDYMVVDPQPIRRGGPVRE